MPPGSTRRYRLRGCARAVSRWRFARSTCASPPESAAYVNEAIGLGLTENDVNALERRTEGRIAALQLAAVSMPGRVHVGAFIA